jgi:hypothetical protein
MVQPEETTTMKVTMLVAALCLLGTAANAQFAFDDGSPFDPNQQRTFEQQRQGLYEMRQQQRELQQDMYQQRQNLQQFMNQGRPVICQRDFFGNVVCQ